MYPVDGWSQGKMKDSKRLPFSEKPSKVPDTSKKPAAPQKTHNKQMQKRGKK